MEESALSADLILEESIWEKMRNSDYWRDTHHLYRRSGGHFACSPFCTGLELCSER